MFRSHCMVDRAQHEKSHGLIRFVSTPLEVAKTLFCNTECFLIVSPRGVERHHNLKLDFCLHVLVLNCLVELHGIPGPLPGHLELLHAQVQLSEAVQAACFPARVTQLPHGGQLLLGKLQRLRRLVLRKVRVGDDPQDTRLLLETACRAHGFQHVCCKFQALVRALQLCVRLHDQIKGRDFTFAHALLFEYEHCLLCSSKDLFPVLIHLHPFGNCHYFMRLRPWYVHLLQDGIRFFGALGRVPDFAGLSQHQGEAVECFGLKEFLLQSVEGAHRSGRARLRLLKSVVLAVHGAERKLAAPLHLLVFNLPEKRQCFHARLQGNLALCLRELLAAGAVCVNFCQRQKHSSLAPDAA
mmetsp:Transcript_150157/g.273341  ORF Transcript_150157/g.273341 Transcript_150157/m.273341 type:complete len:354 (+) Transcript_150157:1067-2128(+)